MTVYGSSARAPIAVLAVLVASKTASCVVSTGPESTLGQSAAPTDDVRPGCQEEALLLLEGVSCPGCAEVIAANLLALDGVVSARVSLSPPEVQVVHCDTLAPEDLVQQVRAAGYEATLED